MAAFTRDGDEMLDLWATTAEEWRRIRAQLQTIVNDPRETMARRVEAQRILAMRPHVAPARADADLFAMEYGL